MPMNVLIQKWATILSFTASKKIMSSYVINHELRQVFAFLLATFIVIMLHLIYVRNWSFCSTQS